MEEVPKATLLTGPTLLIAPCTNHASLLSLPAPPFPSSPPLPAEGGNQEK